MLLKQAVNPKRALDLNIGATLEFLKIVMKDRAAIIRRTMKDEGILSVTVQEEVPNEHKPPGKWIAMRLHIPHEFTQRFIPTLERKVKRALTLEQSPEKEIWMHVTSTPHDVTEWEKKKESGELEKSESMEREAEARERAASKSEEEEKRESEEEDSGSITSG